MTFFKCTVAGCQAVLSHLVLQWVLSLHSLCLQCVVCVLTCGDCVHACSLQCPHMHVCRYVDHKALDGGADGLSVVTEILSVSKHLLTPGG